MKKSLFKSVFAVALTATLLSPTLQQPAQAQFIAPYGTGYMGANGLQYNNGTSAIISTMLQGMQNEAMMRATMRGSSYGRSGPSASDLQRARGRKIIKRRRATTRFKPKQVDSVKLVNDWAKSNANGRAGALAEWREQSALWRAAVTSRGARYDDFAELQTVAFIMAIEAYSGRALSNAAYRKDLPGTRRAHLNSAWWQGKSLAAKQNEAFESMLSATWAMYLRRHGKIEEARKTAAEFIDTYWDKDKNSKYATDADSAIGTYAKYQTGPLPLPGAQLAKAPVTRIKPVARVVRPTAALDKDDAPSTPMMSLEQANKFVQYKPVAPTVLPALLVASEPADKRQESRELYEKMIGSGRERVEKLFSRSNPSKEDVSSAITFALMIFYTAAKTDSGNPSDAGFTEKNVQGIARQYTLVLASDPKFRARSAKDKQTLFEGALLKAVVIGVMVAETEDSDDPALRAKVKQMASDSFRTFVGKTPDQVRLTDNGWQF